VERREEESFKKASATSTKHELSEDHSLVISHVRSAALARATHAHRVGCGVSSLQQLVRIMRALTSIGDSSVLVGQEHWIDANAGEGLKGSQSAH